MPVAAVPLASEIPFPCGHVHEVSFSVQMDAGAPPNPPIVVLQVHGCQEAADWGQSFFSIFYEHLRKGEDRQATLCKDLEVAFSLVHAFGSLYRQEEEKRKEGERELAAFRRACDCWWRRPEEVLRRNAHRH